MSQVSMTYPECLRRECMLDGVIIKLRPQEAELLTLLIVADPNRTVTYEEMIEWLWPNPDTQPLGANRIISTLTHRLRVVNDIPVVTTPWQGLYIPAECRGGRPAVRRRHRLTPDGASFAWAA